jgi:hypothetical protein
MRKAIFEPSSKSTCYLNTKIVNKGYKDARYKGANRLKTVNVDFYLRKLIFAFFLHFLLLSKNA